MRILGISAFQRDAAAALLVDGEIVTAAQEERFTKKAHDPAFPKRAIRYCLDEAGILGRDLDHVVFYEKPLRKFERLLAQELRAFPRSAKIFAGTMFVWLGDRLWLKSSIAEDVGVDSDRILFTEHASAHAAHAFYSSPFDEAGVLCVDDVGEWATTLLASGSGAKLETLAELRLPHSLGLFASAITQFLGFEPGTQESSVEALVPYGKPRFAEALAALIPARPGGAFEVDETPFRFAFDSDVLFGKDLAGVLGEHRTPGATLRMSADDSRDADVAASLQQVMEQRVLALATELAGRVDSRNLCFAGLLAGNARLCARLAAEGPFDALHVAAEPGKAGAAIGAALYAHHQLGGAARSGVTGRSAVFVGEALGEPEEGARAFESSAAAQADLCQRLIKEETCAWVRGRMEFARQALGHRSILADPRPEGARGKLLGAVQRSEAHLPCSLAVPAESAADWFELPAGCETLTARALLSVQAKQSAAQHAGSALEPDGRVRILCVDAAEDPEFHALLVRFGESSGAPLLLHADYALRGSPLVRSEVDALEAFERSALDALYVEDHVYTR
jgi:carbamoyltransferase